MTERRRPYRRGRKRAATDPTQETPDVNNAAEANPYLDAGAETTVASEPPPKRKPGRPRKVRPATSESAPPGDASNDVPRAPSKEASPPPSAPPPAPSAPEFIDRSNDRPSEPPSDRSNENGGYANNTYAPSENGAPEMDRGGNAYDDYRGPRRGRYRRFRQRNRHHQQGQQQGGPQQGNGQPYGGPQHGGASQAPHQQHQHHNNGSHQFNRRHRRGRFEHVPRGPIGPVTVEGEATGWFDVQRDVGFIRNARNSYLSDPNDPLVPAPLFRQYGLRRGDKVTASVGRDQRNRIVAVEITAINDADPAEALRRPDFQSLIASYPDRKLTLETGRPARGGPELTRRAIDLIAPVGFGQRALIVAPARAGKTMLLQAIIEGVAINHPQSELFVLLVDERPEEVSDMITLGYGEVIASSFDMPAARHTDVAEMTLERARRLVELGKDVVIVLDSITRLARAYNTVERGTGRTLSGGLDSSAMAKPKAFFGSARAVSPEHGGGSLTIIATALVETGSRMDDVIFEEFKGTGNCEIKLDRSLAEKRIFPAIDIAISGTRREDKLFRPDQLEHVYTLRRGLQQMPSSSGMEWLIKRIASTTSNDNLLAGL